MNKLRLLRAYSAATNHNIRCHSTFSHPFSLSNITFHGKKQAHELRAAARKTTDVEGEVVKQFIFCRAPEIQISDSTLGDKAPGLLFRNKPRRLSVALFV